MNIALLVMISVVLAESALNVLLMKQFMQWLYMVIQESRKK